MAEEVAGGDIDEYLFLEGDGISRPIHFPIGLSTPPSGHPRGHPHSFN